MASNDLIEMEGEIIDTFRGGVFLVKTDQGQEVNCKPSGKMRQNKINLIMGDRVIIQVSPYDLSVGRVVRRLK